MSDSTVLIDYVAKRKLNPVAVMNTLQDRGIVSDNCVDLRDVAEADVWDAISHIRQVWPEK